MIEPGDILTVEELCSRLKVQKTWVYEKLRLGRGKPNPLPYFRIGRYLRFSWKAVSAWIESHSNVAKPRRPTMRQKVAA